MEFVVTLTFSANIWLRLAEFLVIEQCPCSNTVNTNQHLCYVFKTSEAKEVGH